MAKDSKLLTTKIIITEVVISHGCIEIGMLNIVHNFFSILFEIQLH